MFQKHPSEKLNKLFVEKPFQGVIPENAKFLFIGLDANYSKDIESQEIFDKVFEYHSDGVKFWRKYKVHHPFLLDEYKGDGKKYHKNFARIGFRDTDANLISFIELLNFPTVGRNRLETTDLAMSHLTRINECVVNNSAKYIFVSSSVANLMRKSRQFSWLSKEMKGHYGNLKILWQGKDKTVFSHLHFSNYGKFEKQMQLDAETIRELREEIS